MRRLCTDSSCSYSGRSVWQAAGTGYGSRTEGHDESCGTTTGPYRLFLAARPAVNAGRDRAEVSRRRSSPTPAVMGGTR
jgi:hypothetical protein